MSHIKALIISVLCVLSGPLTVNAQVSILVGYDASLLQVETYNSVLSEHNSLMAYTENFSNLNFLNGILMGIKLRSDVASVHLSMRGKFKNDRAERLINAATFENKIRYSYFSITSGLTAHFDRFGLGATIDYNRNSTKLNFTSPKLDETTKFQGFSNMLFVEYEIPGANSISLSIQPYVQFYWDDWDTKEVRQSLNLPPRKDMPLQRLTTFGISFIFNNSRQ